MNEVAVKKILGRTAIVEQWCCLLAFIIMALALFLDIALRTIVGNGIPWSHQVGVYANMVVALVGIGLASTNGSHLRPRFADGLLPRRFEPVMARLQPLISALFFFLFAVLACQLVIETYGLQERSTVLRSVVWPVQLLLPLTFSIGALRYLLYAIYPTLQPITDIAAE